MQHASTSTPITGGKRLLRGWIAALAATLFAALSHSAAAPVTIEPALLMLGIALAAPVPVFLAKYRFTPLITAASVGLAQVVFHTVFMIAPHGAQAALAQEHHCGPITATGITSTGSDSIFAMALSHATPLMLLAHALAALGTVGLLCYGENLLVALAALLGCLQPYTVLQWVQPVVARRRPIFSGFAQLPSPVLTLLRSVLSHRGPPAPLFAA